VADEVTPAPWLERAARVGYVAKGVVYVVVGISAMLVALGLDERARGSPGALRAIVQLPLGRVLLAALTAGLLGYATLSFVAAVRAPEGGAPGVKRAVVRLVDGLTGALYVGLALVALRLIAEPEYWGGQVLEVYARWVMGRPLGQEIVAAVGAVVVASGLYLAYKSFMAPFAEPFAAGPLDRLQVARVKIAALSWSAPPCTTTRRR
jgi:hypothetical protein